MSNRGTIVTKRILILIFFLCAGLLFLFYILLRGSRDLFTDPFSVVPDDAPFFIETYNFPALMNSLAENNGLLNDMALLMGAGKFADNFNGMRNYLNKNDLLSILENRRAVLSFHLTGDSKLRPLLVLTIPDKVSKWRIEGYIKNIPGTVTDKVLIGRYRINRTFWKNRGDEYTLFWCYLPGLIIFSNVQELVESAINTGEKEKSMRAFPDVSRLIALSSNREDKIYIIFRNLKPLLALLNGNSSKELAEKLSNMAVSAEGDMFINENGYLFSGFVDNTGQSGSFFKHNQDEVPELSAFRRLPSGCIMIETFLISATISEKFKTNKYGFTGQVTGELLPALDGEFVKAVAELRKDAGKNGHIFVFKLKSRDIAEHVILKNMEEWCRQNNMDEEALTSFFQPDDQIKIPIYVTPFKGMASLLSGSENFVPDSLITFYENYMIASGNLELIERFLYDNILNKTLSTEIEFREFETTLPSRASYFFYCKPSAVIDFLRDYLGDTLTNKLVAGRTILKKISCAGYKYLPGENMIYHMLSVRYGEGIEVETGTEWETKLEGAVISKPFFFTNHNTGAKEIVVQDDRNYLYLINAAGRVLWKIEPGERVNGNFFMIDFYGNNKFQILFASRTTLFLYDRNGNPVERFPVKLRSPASGPPSLFDYDNNLNYRIFIPGEDKYIYAYDKYGNVVKGWKPFRTNGTVKSEIKFFRVSGKDYIVAADDKSIYFLDRTGNIRLKTSVPVTCAAGSEIRFDKLVGNSLVFSAPDGTIQTVSFDGKVSRFSTGKFSTEHFFDLFDIDGDGYGEYIFIDRGKLYLYDNDRSELFIRDFGTEKVLGPMNFIFSATDRKIGIYDYANNMIYLVDRYGNNMKDFPLKGYSKFSLGKFTDKGNYNLIVGGNNNFLYNYKLNKEEKD